MHVMIRGTGETMSETGPKRKRDWTIDFVTFKKKGIDHLSRTYPPAPLGCHYGAGYFFDGASLCITFGLNFPFPPRSQINFKLQKLTMDHVVFFFPNAVDCENKLIIVPCFCFFPRLDYSTSFPSNHSS
ncbi:MAG: hypothetical protein CM1200mP29_05090 [Verrucomicrobiota bacterium]|nr:MAG: hypothetical protein CM1200mP29_05090 [Verrucomicrobiota bacterium]